VNIVEGDTLEIFATKDGSVIIRKKSTTTIGNGVFPKVEEPRVYTIKEGYNNQQFIIKITPEQDRLLDYLLDNDLLDSNLAIHTGYPEIEDLT
jgi:bifunctional DNA-binding transcriptional regulator/antitoxin component of YhaV-PrlF toxin-antitoxin module